VEEQARNKLEDVNEGVEEIRGKVEGQIGDVKATYERARLEMNQALERLRSEINRLDMQQAQERAVGWVRENPALAAAIAAGMGIAIGRLLGMALRPAPPPPFHVRARQRVLGLAQQAGHLAEETGEAVARRAVDVGGMLKRGTTRYGGFVADRSRTISSDVARRATDMAENVGEHAVEWADIATRRAQEAAASLQEAAHDTRQAFGLKSRRGHDLSDTLASAARTIMAAAMIRKVNAWIRR
jgi:ElaB/YqjD/DUF883 family membrane-anchored ribosome-binding protein